MSDRAEMLPTDSQYHKGYRDNLRPLTLAEIDEVLRLSIDLEDRRNETPLKLRRLAAAAGQLAAEVWASRAALRKEGM